MEERTATRRSAVESGRVALKRTIQHKGGSTLTKPQVEANDRLSGMDQKFYVNQVLLLLENDLIDPEDGKIRPLLMRLRSAIDGFLG